MKRNIHILFVFLLIASGALAQKTNVAKALRYYQAEKLDSAVLLIDMAKDHEETSSDPNTWYYRGFIYKEIYNRDEKLDKESNAREQAIISFEKSFKMDTTDKRTESTIKSIKYLATTLYNDAATSLNPEFYELAISNFDKYKSYMLIIEPEKDFSDLEIQFNLVLGSVYTQIYEMNREKNSDFFNRTRDAYMFVLDKEQENLSANYNLGILFYNEAVNKIKDLDYDLDLITLELIQDECVDLFRKALPYMNTAYELNPTRKETLIGLSGIYFSLNELEKSERLQKELEMLEQND